MSFYLGQPVVVVKGIDAKTVITPTPFTTILISIIVKKFGSLNGLLKDILFDNWLE